MFCNLHSSLRRFSAGLFILLWLTPARAADVAEARQLFLSGEFERTAEAAKAALEKYGSKEEWQLLLIKALLSSGRYPEALQETSNALSRNSWSVQLRWVAREVFLSNGMTQEASEMLDEVINTVSAQPRAYREARDLVVFGQAALLKGADPKRVLDTVFETARKADPKLRDVYLAAGELALEKHDYELAARKFDEGLKQLPDDPDLHFGMARAYAPSDVQLMQTALESALERNSNHVGCLLLLADNRIDAEAYEKAEEFLDRVQKGNPAHPDAWAYRAVIAHFRNQPEEEKKARAAGLKHWRTNPRVDYLIGKKLSQHYRFSEGAAYQRQALQHQQDYLPAKAQLAQDLLRLGEEEEGWRLAEEVHKEDGYDVEAYNLTTLRSTLDKFTVITNDHFRVRMSAHEAALYGPRVLELLESARTNLCAKYGLELATPTLVEIFPDQRDFAVRTFGMPGNPGYLGVCFGAVITANSPASQIGRAVNWEAVLYHEFCHVITLQLTKNKMPRWLSEGISVYEEVQCNPAWGQGMTPRYREMILEGELTPVSKLSGAFMAPESDLHLQFAYYQSSLAVEFIIQRFGLEKLRAVLQDLGEGTEINTALAKHTAPMPTIDADFEKFARERAKSLAPGLDWERPPGERALAVGAGARRGNENGPTRIVDLLREGQETEDFEEWAKARPTNFWVMMRQIQELISEGEWGKAKPVLIRLVEHYPEFTGSDSAYRLLAQAHRVADETEDELSVLKRFAEVDDQAVDAYARLMELGEEGEDWETVKLNARRYLAVNPLVSDPYRFLARASERSGDLDAAIFARRALLQLDPADPAEAHFSLARLLHRKGGSEMETKKHVLRALEEAPRYRAALKLLLELNAPVTRRSEGAPSPLLHAIK